MFRIECLCEDKHLAMILRTLASAKAQDVVSVPVVGAEMERGKVRINGTGSQHADAIATYLKKSKLKFIDNQHIKSAFKAAGVAYNSGGIRYAIKYGVIKRSSRGTYEAL